MSPTRATTLRSKTERVIEEMTTELLELYARRKAARGHPFPPDTEWQREMEDLLARGDEDSLATYAELEERFRAAGGAGEAAAIHRLQ